MAKKQKNSENCKIDKKDIAIIKILEDDGRIPFLELGRKIKLSHETVRYRVNKLMKAGVIKKFSVRIDKKKLGYDIYGVVLISTGNYTQEDWNEFHDYLIKHEQIVNVEKVTGNYDLKFAFWAKNVEEFDTIAHSIKTKFSKIIKNWNSFIFTNRFKGKELPF